MRNFAFLKIISVIFLITTLICFNACTKSQLKAIDPPPPSSKLRIAILPVTEGGPFMRRNVSHEKWANITYNVFEKQLDATGIYEVVPSKDVDYVFGAEVISTNKHHLLKNEGALIKQYGKALHAEYVMIVVRRSFAYYTDIYFTNVENGMIYSVSGSIVNMTEADTSKLINLHNILFNAIKGDLLATALRKGRLVSTEETKISTSSQNDPPKVASKKEHAQIVEILPPLVPSASKPLADKTRIVVHDFNASEQLQVVALIVSEILREELFKLGNYSRLSN